MPVLKGHHLVLACIIAATIIVLRIGPVVLDTCGNDYGLPKNQAVREIHWEKLDDVELSKNDIQEKEDQIKDPARDTVSNVLSKNHPKRDWDWTDLFSFVPFGVKSCPNIFRDNDKFLVEPFLNAYNSFTTEVARYNNIEGNSALRVEQYLTYIKIAEFPFIKTVCETGFNAGHSTLAWLETNPWSHVYSFDLGIHDYARPMSEYLKTRYPGRLNMTWGDSTVTLPEFRRNNPGVSCDLIIIDGGHTHPICQSDYENLKLMSSSDNIVILDNYPDSRLKWMEDLGSVWERGKRKGELVEIFGCSFEPNSPHGFSIGRFNIK